jgi:transposase InsO family protein
MAGNERRTRRQRAAYLTAQPNAFHVQRRDQPRREGVREIVAKRLVERVDRRSGAPGDNPGAKSPAF